jgi:monofunctional biosynthetic peptidoglycan transglycosylase
MAETARSSWWRRALGWAWRLLALMLVSLLALQLYFLLRIGLMAVVNPASTTFERSELWRLASSSTAQGGNWRWQQQWVQGSEISPRLARAVITSEDDTFAQHDGVRWESLEKAWSRNQKAQAKAQAQAQARQAAKRPGADEARAPKARPAKLVGGSTITQQLAKNLFLGPERKLARKAQELVITFMLEALLSKERILEIYLNHVEWGEGVFGAQAAAQRYFGLNAKQLSNAQAARLAVMLPAPKRFEKNPTSAYIANRAAVIEGRMAAAELP